MPETPEIPEIPKSPETLETLETPETAGTSETPKTPLKISIHYLHIFFHTTILKNTQSITLKIPYFFKFAFILGFLSFFIGVF